MPTNKPLIDAAEVLQLIDKPNVVFIDARSGADAANRFAAGHLAGAVHADLDKDLSAVKLNAADGGRHPLPPLSAFVQWLGKAGIDPASRVIIYDDKAGANAAARCWWMLRAVGHQQVQVVNGGLQALQAAGAVLSATATDIKEKPAYPASDWQMPVASIGDVTAAAADPHKLVIDVREAYRYQGDSEPIDLVAGHIPGAVNQPYIGNLDAAGKFQDVGQLQEIYQPLLKNKKEVIVHCGSGVTACHTLLALEQAGITGARLYVGSWSEWSRNDKPIATGNE